MAEEAGFTPAARPAESQSTAAVLILVHPGSACGSANFNIGHAAARDARRALVDDLRAWQHGLLVIDGELSDELDSYPVFGEAIEQALKRAAIAGKWSQRVLGDDGSNFDQVVRAAEFVARLGPAAKEMRFVATGAWYEKATGGGCVGSVVGKLRELGCKVEVAESAVELPSEEDDDQADDAGSADNQTLVDRP